MESITHLFYGGVIAAAIAPRQHRRAALLAGMVLNTLPDLDVLPLLLSDDPIVRMTWHRAATHSWFVLPLVAWGI
ncbi:MAG TPA: metal-dependent hydrolase, partial [Thermomonas sp.]|nr:metal-dependent hydrolase [Thermomonas sp.]